MSTRSSFIYSDINPRMTLTSCGSIDIAYDRDAVVRSIRNILATVSGERVRSPIGSRLVALLFEPISNETAEDIVDEIRSTITRYEPRVSNLRVRINPNIDSHIYDVRIQFRVRGLNGEEVIRLPLRAI